MRNINNDLALLNKILGYKVSVEMDREISARGIKIK